MHLSSLHELLTERRDLVKRYFSKPNLTNDEYVQMHHEFNSTNYVPKTRPEVIANFNDGQLSLIANYVNKAKLFDSVVSPEQMKAFFECRLEEPLTANNLGHVALFIESLSQTAPRMVCYGWKKMVAEHGMLRVKFNKRICTATAISSRLSEIIAGAEGNAFGIHESLIKKLKEMM